MLSVFPKAYVFAVASTLLLAAASLLVPLTADAAEKLGRKPRPSAELPQFRKCTGIFPDGFNGGHVNWVDVNNDLKPDLFIGGRLFINQSNRDSFKFEDATAASGLKGGGPLLCIDLDNDGWTDVVTAGGQVLRNNGDGTFTDIADSLGFAPHQKAMTLAAGDLDGNGFPDILIGMREDWNDGNPKYYPFQCWLNDGGKKLREAAAELGINASSYARGVLVHDIDNDGRQDIFVANYRLQANFLWMNLRGLKFVNEAKKRGVAGRFEPHRFHDKLTRQDYGFHYGHCIAACWIDLDNDGQLDLWVSNLAHKFVGATGRRKLSFDCRGYLCDDSSVYKNNHGFFTDWRQNLRIPVKPIGDQSQYRGDELWAGATAADVNNDGFQDVFVPQVYNLDYARALLYVNCAGVGFAEGAIRAGIQQLDTYCGAWADANGDGLQDLLTAGRVCVDAKPECAFYVNEGNDVIKQTTTWLQVTLRSTPAGGTAVGAVVRVSAAGGTQTQLNSAGISTYGQQNSPALHFGFPQKIEEAEAEIRWPDGHVSRHRLKCGQNQVVMSDAR